MLLVSGTLTLACNYTLVSAISSVFPQDHELQQKESVSNTAPGTQEAFHGEKEENEHLLRMHL